MEIIPLIEYTLLIFIGLLLIVLFTSYIFFLFKRKVKKTENLQERSLQLQSSEFQEQQEFHYLIPLDEDNSSENELSGQYNGVTGSVLSLTPNEQKQSSTTRFTVINQVRAENLSGYFPGRLHDINRFSPSKSSEAFARFK